MAGGSDAWAGLRGRPENHFQRAKQLVYADRDQCDADGNERVFDPAVTLSSEHVLCLRVGTRTGGGYAGESERPAAC